MVKESVLALQKYTTTMDAAADSTTDNPTTESTQQPAVPTHYPFIGSLDKKEVKRSIKTEEFTLSTQKPKTNQSMKESILSPAASKDNNIDATPQAPSCDQHKEHTMTSK